MPQYVLVGGHFEIYDTAFQGDQHNFRCVLGAVFEMDEPVAIATIKHGSALLPKERYDKLGITSDEEKKYPNARLQGDAPAPFKEKLLAARIAVHDYRAELIAQEG